MAETLKQRERTVHVVSLSDLSSSPKQERQLKDDLPTLFANLRQILLQKSANDGIDSNIRQYIESIKTKIDELKNLAEPKQAYDNFQGVMETYINTILSINQCPNILSNSTFQEIFLALTRASETVDLVLMYIIDDNYARTVFYRSFEMLSLPAIKDFLNENYPKELFSHLANIVYVLLDRIGLAIAYVSFNKKDLQNQVSTLRLLVEYTDRNKQNIDQDDIYRIVNEILSLFWNLADSTILVPTLVQSNCATYFVTWISLADVSMKIQRSCMHILHNLARHEQGVQALNNANCINVLKDFKKRILDPNKTNDDELYVELRLFYCMVLSLLTEPKDNRDDLNNLRKVLDQLMELLIYAGESEGNRGRGFHASEPLVVLTKLCVHDEILNYILKESPVKTTNGKSKIEFFCGLLMKFRGALASENELDQLTLNALINMIWSISFHDEYIEELKADSKFLMTVKSLANDDGEALVDQYVPRYMSSIPKAATGILWNLDENNPARMVRTAAPAPAPTTKSADDTKKAKGRMRVMISYAHADQEFCHQLVDALQKDNRFDIWVDFAYCHTEDLWEEIGEAIEKADIVLLLMTKDYQDSKSCRTEVMYTKDSLKKRFIPIYVKKEFVATSWLGVRIVGPQYVRFGKKPFDETVKELIKIIVDEKNQQEPQPSKETKPAVVPPPPAIEDEPIDKTNIPTKPIENTHPIQSDLKPSDKPVEKWTRKDITQWLDQNQIQQELIDLYDFQHGTDLLLYSQCLRPDWQNEYTDIRARYQQKYNTPLYRDQFVRFVGAIHRLQPSQANSKSCIIS